MSLYVSMTQHVDTILRDHRGAAMATAAAMATGAVLVYRSMTKKRYKLPPGPTPLPLVGNLIEIYRQENANDYFDKLKKKFGDIFTIYIGSTPVVMMYSSELVREAFIRQGDAISGRPTTYSLDLFSDYGKDIIFGQATDMWKAQRKIMHGALRKYAVGDHLEDLVYDAVEMVSLALEKRGSEPVNIQKYISLMVYNIILTMTCGKRMEIDDEFFSTFIDEVDLLNDLVANGLVADYIPIMRFIPTKALRTVKAFTKKFIDYLKSVLREHRETYNPDSITDFTYHLLKMEHEVSEEEDPGVLSQMTEAHIIQLMSDLFFAGTDTTRMTVTWIVQFLAMYPEMQTRIRTEIQDVIGSRREVKATDRESLPFTYSFIHEVLRLRPLATVDLPHVAVSDTKIEGYDIPTGTYVTANFRAIHHDPREWEEPEQFKPERFLDGDGQFVTRPGWLPFSAGKRGCVGESMAKIELMMIVAQLVRRLSFHPAPGETLTGAYRNSAFDMFPLPFTVVVKPVDT